MARALQTAAAAWAKALRPAGPGAYEELVRLEQLHRGGSGLLCLTVLISEMGAIITELPSKGGWKIQCGMEGDCSRPRCFIRAPRC